MAQNDVLDMIINVCEKSLENIKKCNNVTELASSYNALITTVIGICGGAKMMKKGE